MTVRAYRRDQENFNWELGGQGLSFEVDSGRLSNGNHRSLALQGAKEGTLIHQLCVFGVEEDNAVDTGITRTLGDELTREGKPNGPAVAALALRMEAIDHEPAYPVYPAKSRKASRLELLKYINKHPELTDIAKRTKHVEAIPEYVTPMVAGVILLLLRRAASGLTTTGAEVWADQFFDSWTTMVSVESGNPIHELRRIVGKRRTLRETTATRDARRAAPNLDEVIVLAMLAWNKWQQNQHISLLKLPIGGGVNNQNFPWPVGYEEWKRVNAITAPAA